MLTRGTFTGIALLDWQFAPSDEAKGSHVSRLPCSTCLMHANIRSVKRHVALDYRHLISAKDEHSCMENVKLKVNIALRSLCQVVPNDPSLMLLHSPLELHQPGGPMLLHAVPAHQQLPQTCACEPSFSNTCTCTRMTILLCHCSTERRASPYAETVTANLDCTYCL